MHTTSPHEPLVGDLQVVDISCVVGCFLVGDRGDVIAAKQPNQDVVNQTKSFCRRSQIITIPHKTSLRQF